MDSVDLRAISRLYFESELECKDRPQPIIQNERDDENESDDENERDDVDVYSIPTFGCNISLRYSTYGGWGDEIKVYSNMEQMFEGVFGEGVQSAKKIRWCFWSDLRPVPMLSTICYGNDANPEEYYQSAALLVKVPAFEERVSSADTTNTDREICEPETSKKRRIE